ncbi:hypothetical protein SRABI27_02625 [Pedobacter sp. Bi27]|nr:hypothetical protein SRABI27_02625 [Pedobacter sp. Bi27]CAH0250215.1 hypothetical protein SRABI36_03197 [Pedobacter sp. Bi36]CAH0275192.1 hypothetical protein SRABI126_03599 [Pedobacter sp. Bi126]
MTNLPLFIPNYKKRYINGYHSIDIDSNLFCSLNTRSKITAIITSPTTTDPRLFLFYRQGFKFFNYNFPLIFMVKNEIVKD